MIKEDFFGRQDILAILDKRLKGLKEGYRQNIALIGDKLIGKTSIIKQFLSSINDGEIVVVYLDIIGHNLKDLLNKFIASIAYSFSEDKTICYADNIELSLEHISKVIPKTTEKIKIIKSNLENKKKDESFYDIFELSKLIHQETSKFCLIILEEIHNLEYLGLRNIYKEFGKKIILDKTTMYLITSSHTFKARKILSESLSLLFGNFEIIDVEPFDVKTADNYIKNKFTSLTNTSSFGPGSLSGFTLGVVLKSFLINFTEGYPFYISIISDAMKEKATANQTQISELDLFCSALEDLLFHRWSILNQHYEAILDNACNCRDSQGLIEMLLLISAGYRKLKDLNQALHQRRRDTSLKINRLLESNIISKNGDLVKINDPVFNFWLKSVYKNRVYSLNLDSHRQLELFHETIAEAFRSFVVDSQKAILDRLIELFTLFADEVVHLEKRRFKLSHFRELKLLKFNGPRIKDGILGRSSNSLWLTALKQDNISEDDVLEFAKECKKYKDRTQRKIMFTFNDVDGNARILAKEEKIFIWNINNLNSLLGLYGRPRIVP